VSFFSRDPLGPAKRAFRDQHGHPSTWSPQIRQLHDDLMTRLEAEVDRMTTSQPEGGQQ
jgi:hypothetical protein